MSATARRISLPLFISIALVAVIILGVYRHPARGLAAQPQVPNSIGESADAAGFAMAAERDISELQDGITVSQWKTHHVGQDKEIPARPGSLECVSLKSEARISGGRITRLVLFYPPEAPSPAILPNLRGQELLDETCLLGQIQIEMSTATPGAARVLSEAIKRELARVYGPADKKWRWVPNAQWQFGKVDIISDYYTDGPYVYMYAGLPVSNPSMKPSPSPDRVGQLAEFRRAVATANIDPSISARMEKLYELDVTVSDDLSRQFEKICMVRCPGENEYPKPAGNEWREPLVPVLRDWLEALKPLGPERRAAGLFAADRLLSAFEGVGGQQYGPFGMDSSTTSVKSPESATELRSKLESLGAKFTTDSIEGPGPVYSYASNWLEEASQIVPGSDWGRMAAIAWMSKRQCQDPEKIIFIGEKLLATNPDAHTAAQAHFLIGDAYSDMVAAAAWARDENGADYAAKDKGKAGMAKSKALRHYTAGLADDTASDEAKRAWVQAWHLYAGLQPEVRYLCAGD